MIISKNRASVPVRPNSATAAVAALLAGQLAIQDVAAQDDAATITVDVAECAELQSDAERVECFGSQVNAILEARANDERAQSPVSDETTDAPTETALDVRATPATSEDTAEDAQLRRERPASLSAGNRAPDQPEESTSDQGEFSGTIVSFRERIPFSYVIMLDNGQIWEQVEPRKYPLRPGLEVRIYPTRWGRTYRLSGAGTGGYIRVRRVR